MMRLVKRLLIGILALLTLAAIGAAFVYRSIPNCNTELTHFDTLIVLGTPANLDGTPSPEQRERTLEGVREFKAGVAPHIIVTGGPAHNRFVEAQGMAALAIAKGVPASAVAVEDKAQNTIQNIYYSERMMEAHHWTSAEVISSPSHLPRTALILEHYSFAWRTHAAPWPTEYTWEQRAVRYCVEAEYCMRLRLMGFPATPFLPSHV
jgi:uncharacterized SAM-binding protein YcdF (DUF218 family)